MSDDISPNKVGDKQKRRAEAIKSNLMDQGMGRDHAAKEALRQAVEESPGGCCGGPNAAGQPQKPTEFVGSHRSPSDQESKD